MKIRGAIVAVALGTIGLSLPGLASAGAATVPSCGVVHCIAAPNRTAMHITYTEKGTATQVTATYGLGQGTSDGDGGLYINVSADPAYPITVWSTDSVGFVTGLTVGDHSDSDNNPGPYDFVGCGPTELPATPAGIETDPQPGKFYQGYLTFTPDDLWLQYNPTLWVNCHNFGFGFFGSSNLDEPWLAVSG